MSSRRASKRSHSKRPAWRGRAGGGDVGLLGLLVLLVSITVLACETRHRSAVLVPVGFHAASSDVVSAGILRRTDGQLDEVASRHLVDASRAPDVSSALSPADRDRLLAEPFRLAYAAAWRSEFQRRIGHRYVLVGELAESRIETRIEWLPIFLIWITPPFELARRADVPHPVFELRLVDLEAGRIEAEFFAMMPGKAGREGLSAVQLEAALVSMGLRGERR